MVRAAWSMTCTPMEKLAAMSSAPMRARARASSDGIWSSHPVVPHTTGMPAASRRATFAGAVPGVVNSRATSTPVSRAGTSAAPPAFSWLPTIAAMECPRASSAACTERPIRPVPITTARTQLLPKNSR